MLICCFEHGHPIKPLARAWLNQLYPSARSFTIQASPYLCARNLAVRDVVLKSDEDEVIFIDNDVTCTVSTDLWACAEGDVVACRCRTRCGNIWTPTTFHTPLWRAKTEVFRRLSPPWFKITYTDDYCDTLGCECEYFARKAREAGFNVSNAGWCSHASAGTCL